ncbi:MAG: HPr kinase/phosphorylase [Paracoccaceae bacterium]|jgi:HPr kinase/phosphorylase
MHEKLILHATTVSLNAQALVIVGPSGSGKSSFALALMALGARLVADDQTLLIRQADRVLATCPPALKGLIEARGIGILKANYVQAPVLVIMVLDMGQRETKRRPLEQKISLCGVDFPLLLSHDHTYFPSRVFHAMKFGWADK